MANKISQTQRKHMVNRLNQAIRKKRSKIPDVPGINGPNFSLPSKYSASSFDEEELTWLEHKFKELAKEKSRILKEAKALVKLNKKRDIQIEKLEKLEVDLTDELMLGNDLKDLLNVLKKVEEA